MKVGIIRCQQTEDLCPGVTDFKIAREGTHAFEETGPVEIVGFVSCGGCPGKRAVQRAKMLKHLGAERIVLASCITRGNPVGITCPHAAAMKQAIQKKLGPDFPMMDWTH